ncbi:MAG: insulinase family protein [Chitinispirillia bacterium]|nr:insulinase family protein [Chitinispirillia bacterium]MCL2241250.1 insulinase family protein [Chitinispirillia bacterium]
MKKINFTVMMLIAFIVIANCLCVSNVRTPGAGPAGGNAETRGTAVDTAWHLEERGAAARHPSEIAFDSLDWKVPLGGQYRVELKNGPVAYVAADSSLPLISIEAYIRSGSLGDPAGREGLGALMSALLRTGGTKHYHADTLDMLIDLYAMNFSFSQTESHIIFRSSFLYEYLDTAMHIMSQMFHNPAFDARKLERERSIMLEGISHRFVNPGPALNAAYRKHSYAGQTPARLSTEKSVKSITRADIVKLHKNVFDSSVIIMSASGKFDRDAMIARLNALFPKAIVPVCPLADEIRIAPRTRALVVHKQINQAYIRMGLPLFRRPHPDYYAVSVLNYILGGAGFTSRLGSRVRSDEGLTYSIHSRAESNYTYPGTIYIDFFTGPATYPKAVAIILEELDKAVKDGVTEKELEDARASLIAELPSSFRSPEDIVSTYAWNEFYGREPDHYAKYPDELRKLTLDDIKAAAKKYVDVNKMTFTVVGDTTAINAANAAAVKDGFFVLDSLKSKRVVSADSLVHLP